MKNLTRLVTKWDAYTETNPEATIEEFCIYILQTARADRQGTFASEVNHDDTFELTVNTAKLIGRVSAINHVYIKLALKEFKISPDWYYILNFLYKNGETRKIDIINFLLMEPSTGIDILQRVTKAGLVAERTDPLDKRAKLIKLTSKGKDLYLSLLDPVYRATLFLYSSLTDDEKTGIINTLANLENSTNYILQTAGTKYFPIYQNLPLIRNSRPNNTAQ